MSCNSCRNPYDSIQDTWSQKGDLVQNDYTPPNGWPYNPKNTWPQNVAEGYSKSASYSQSRYAWRNFGGDSNYMSMAPITAIPAMYAQKKQVEKYTPGSKTVGSTNFSTLKNTWLHQKPYTSN